MKFIVGSALTTLLFVVSLVGGLAAVVSTMGGTSGQDNPSAEAIEAAGVSTGPVKEYVQPTAAPTGTVQPSDTVSVQGIRVHKSIATNVDRLLNAARSDGVALSGWGYRSNAKQIELRIRHCGGNNNYAIYQKPSGSCSPPTATPGRSQHEKGLAIDFKNCPRSSACFGWLTGNAARFGFKNLPSESWHWSTTGR